jgi:indolepyruvate ferredoxin oxidoreductase
LPTPTIIAGNKAISLDDKWTLDSGRVVMNGIQAIARVLLAQSALDHKCGVSTAGYITGYRGSPLGNVDKTLWSISDRLTRAKIIFQPGLNEDIAATAVRGTQQIESVPGARYDGVFAAWYGKGPGVDRSGDAFKHGNYAGTHPNGGVLLFYGDDHAGKSSTVAHQSEQAIAASLIPSLYPADVREMLDYGLMGFALSRYSGSWVAIKCVNEVAEQTATIDLQLNTFAPVLPPRPDELPGGIHIQQGAFNPLGEERIVVEHRLPLVHAFVRENAIDRIIIRAQRPQLGIVTAGKSYGDVRAALALLGLDDQAAAQAGISLYKVGCIWPLEPTGITAFSRGHQTLLVVEEKKSFIEQQMAAVLINERERPLVIGKVDEHGAPLLSSTLPLEPAVIARTIVERLDRRIANAPTLFGEMAPKADPGGTPALKRSPYFCSGCPHNRSTRIPEGSVSMTGIGCHTMVNFVRPKEALLPTQMGGEGGNWIGLAPFTDTKHVFQNMGDGTYYHSGLLAIRAAVAAGVNITYKILYNDAVAMTGGQPVDGPISVAQMARQVRDEGVKMIVLLSDDPARHRGNAQLPSQVTIGHRDELDAFQRELREVRGCTVLIYEQTCAAEKRRRRKRNTIPDPPKRLFISKAACEACGDCSVQSTCVSLTSIETEFGRKREIDQSSCNKDYSCLNGFCPSFITVYAEPRKPKGVPVDERLFAALPEPVRAPISHDSCNIMIAGIGGTGVVTVGALIGMAAHIDGLAMSHFDMTGLSQKNGAVYGHLRIARQPGNIYTQRLGQGEADLLMAFDLVAALSPEAAITLASGRTRTVANAAVSPTVALQFDRDFVADPSLLLTRLKRMTDDAKVFVADASALALAILGDTIGANLFLVGVAAQQGLLPVGVAAIERAVELNGVALAFNLRAFRLGRLFAADPERVLSLVPRRIEEPALPLTLGELVAHRAAHLCDYQDERLAERYRTLVERVHQREAEISPGSGALALAVARIYAKLLAYKDEYEIARLLTQPELHDEIRRTFDGGRIAFNMAPPILSRGHVNGRPKKREIGVWILPVLRVLARIRRIRGTWLDPFGHTAERRMERELIAEYEALVDRVLLALTPANHARAVVLLALPEEVRGFGPVKKKAVKTYHTRLAMAEEKYFARE